MKVKIKQEINVKQVKMEEEKVTNKTKLLTKRKLYLNQEIRNQIKDRLKDKTIGVNDLDYNS